MLYVLEGCDGSGKSTLARFLSKLLNAEVIHCSQHTPNDREFFKSIIYATKDKNIIADRFCYGQFVYQDESDRPLAEHSLLGLNSVSSYEGLLDLEFEMIDWGVKVIYVDAPTALIEHRLEYRNEKILNGLSVEDIKNRYKDIRKRSMLTWVDYYTGGDLYDWR